MHAVFSNIPDKSKLDAEEIFGPVLVMHEFKTEEEALRQANDTECMSPLYGLLLCMGYIETNSLCQMDSTRLSSPKISAGLYVWLVLSKPVT